MSKIATKWIEDDAVTAAKINADVAGDGLVPNGGTGALDLNVDDSTVETNADILRVKALGIGTTQLAATSVTAAKLGSDVAGDGLTGGNGSDIDVQADVTGGANLATVINVSANGVAVKINDSTIGENGSNQLEVKANSIGPSQIDETSSYTWITGSHDFTGASSVTVPTPTSDTHAVTKAYADGLRQGVAIKDPCRALADADQSPLSGLPSNIDGVTGWSAGERVLLTNQSPATENGIWEVQSSTWTRPGDFDTGDSAAGAQTWINEGTNYGDSQWTCTTDPPSDVIDTNNLTFTQTSGAGQITAGVGLTKTGNTIHIGAGTTGDISGINRTADQIAVAVDNSTLEISGNQVIIKALGVGTTQLAATSVTAAKLGSDVAGDGLTGGNGSDLDVQADATGGANLATVINVSANGVAVKIDDSSIGENGSNQLEVKADGVDKTRINADVAGEGISQAAGGELDLDINGLTNTETVADNADLIAVYDQTDGRVEKMTRGNFLAGATGTTQYQEMHLITSGESTNGYFTLSNTPTTAVSVMAWPQKGPVQINKDAVGATGATPDFHVLSSTQFHFNNNGAATGLSGDIGTNDIIVIAYEY